MGCAILAYREIGQRLGPLAQLVEHRTFNPGVVGSTPTRPTTLPGAGKSAQLAPSCGDDPMRVMELVEATEDSEARAMPSADPFQVMWRV